MIKAAKTERRRQLGGFSLIEMVLVLAIAAMVMGGAVGLLVYHSSERVLKKVSSEVEVFAKQARLISLLQQRPYAIQFLPGKILMKPLAEITGPAETSGKSAKHPEAESVVDELHTTSPVHKEITLDGGITVSIRRWGSERWIEMDEKHSQVWRFDPSGLSEPITVRMVYEGSSHESEYHPLTASIRSSYMEIKN
jgi:prepilin-type N-terminal cleavage/methylation domain-containing protein